MFDFITLTLFTAREGLFMLAGAFIAWNVTRPEWSVKLQAAVVAKYNELLAKVKAKFAK